LVGWLVCWLVGLLDDFGSIMVLVEWFWLIGFGWF
jgi:hypothetical protein